MQTRTYTERSNARRAARKAGVDPNLVVETDDGFTFPMPAEDFAPTTFNGPAIIDAAKQNGSLGNGADPQASAEAMKAAHAEDERDVEIAEERLREIEDNPDSVVSGDALQERLGDATGSDEPAAAQPSSADDGLDIPESHRLSAEQRKEAWAKNPPKPAAKPETKPMAKAKTTKSHKGEKPKMNGKEKDALLMKMLAGKGATVDAMCEALGWLPHSLRARISGIQKPKSKGGYGVTVERIAVGTYRIAS